MNALNLFALACFCFLLKIMSNAIFKPLTAKWFTLGISVSVTAGHLLFIGLAHFNFINIDKPPFELFILASLGTWILSLIPLNFIVLPILYWRDKRIASKGAGDKLRIPENAFHALTFSGGYIGAWIGQSQFNHKVSKKSFQIKHYAVCVVSICLYIYIGYSFYNTKT